MPNSLPLQQQLTATNKSLDIWNAEHASYGEAFVDDDSAHNRQQLLNAARQVEVHTTKIKVLNDRIATLAAQRASLDAAVQRAHAVLSTVSTEVRIEVLEAEIKTYSYRIAQAEQSIFENGKLRAAAKQEKLELETGVREAAWRAHQPLMREKCLQANPHMRNERTVTRQGF